MCISWAEVRQEHLARTLRSRHSGYDRNNLKLEDQTKFARESELKRCQAQLHRAPACQLSARGLNLLICSNRFSCLQMFSDKTSQCKVVDGVVGPRSLSASGGTCAMAKGTYNPPA
jgi:hypothetical protein